MNLIKSILALALLAASVADGEAATLSRVVVSASGTDGTSCGTDASPCRTVQGAVRRAASGGLVAVTSGGSFGFVNLTESVRIENVSGAIATLQRSTGAVVTVSLDRGESVTIRGFTIDGLGTAGTGVSFGRTGKLVLSDVTIARSLVGLSVIPTADGQVLVDHSLFDGNNDGVVTSGVNSGTLNVALSDVTITGRGGGVGVSVSGGTAAYQVTAVTRATVTGNLTGVRVSATDENLVRLLVSQSAIINNDQSALLTGGRLALDDTTLQSGAFRSISNGGVIESFGNNAILDGIQGNPVTPIAPK